MFGLDGLLRLHIGTLADQSLRRKRVLDSRETAFGKYSNMRDLQDNDEVAAMKEQGLSEEQARHRIYAFNLYGLLVEGRAASRKASSRWCTSVPISPAGNSQRVRTYRCSTWCAMQR